PYLTAVFTYPQFSKLAIAAVLLITSVFFLQEPLLSLIRIRRSRTAQPERFDFFLRWTIVYLAACLITLALLLYLAWRPLLAPFGTLSGLIFVLHLSQQRDRTDRTISGEVLSVLALTMTAPITRYILVGRLDFFAFVLWILNALYFASSIFY